MKYEELKGMTREEREKKQQELAFELMKAQAQAARGTVAKDPHQIKNMKKALAKIKMISNSKIKAASKKQEAH